MSYRNIFLVAKKIDRSLDHRFRKFQKSKLPVKVSTPAKKIKKLVEVEVEVEQ